MKLNSSARINNTRSNFKKYYKHKLNQIFRRINRPNLSLIQKAIVDLKDFSLPSKQKKIETYERHLFIFAKYFYFLTDFVWWDTKDSCLYKNSLYHHSWLSEKLIKRRTPNKPNLHAELTFSSVNCILCSFFDWRTGERRNTFKCIW